jgi:Concanavalin A-like lectin/glucanases superfamily
MYCSSRNPVVLGVVVAVALVLARDANSALLVNYQFESTVPAGGGETNSTTPDSSGTFPSAGATPFSNALLGYSTNLPTLTAGPVSNPSLHIQSLNPDNFYSFTSSVSSSGTRNNYTDVQIDDAYLPNSNPNPLDAQFSSFSVALWVNHSSTTNYRYMAGKMGGSGQRGWALLSDSGTTDLHIDYFDDMAGTNERELFLPDGTFPLDTWTHLAFTFDGTSGTENIYINGVDTTFTASGAASVPSTLNGSNNTDFKVGHRGATGSTIQGWIGGLDDVRVYSSTLTQAEVQGLIVTVPEPSAIVLSAIVLSGAVVFRFGKRKHVHV